MCQYRASYALGAMAGQAGQVFVCEPDLLSRGSFHALARVNAYITYHALMMSCLIRCTGMIIGGGSSSRVESLSSNQLTSQPASVQVLCIGVCTGNRASYSSALQQMHPGASITMQLPTLAHVQTCQPPSRIRSRPLMTRCSASATNGVVMNGNGTSK